MKPVKKNKIQLPRRIKVPRVAWKYVSYKNPEALKFFMTEQGYIVPRHLTRITQKMQRKLTLEIKRARFLAMLPYTQTLR